MYGTPPTSPNPFSLNIQTNERKNEKCHRFSYFLKELGPEAIPIGKNTMMEVQ